MASAARPPDVARIGVAGTGAWGTTLAALLAANGHDVYLLARSREEARLLDRERENRRFRPGLRFPETLFVVDHPSEMLGCAFLVLAVPAASMRANMEGLLPFIKPQTTIVSATKGIEDETALTMSRVIAGYGFPPAQVCVISGPNFSAEIAAGLPAATVIAGADAGRTVAAQQAFSTPRFRVYTTDDVIGVELAGSLKNVVAIACGISDGLGSGQNARAALMTRALAEIARLGVAAGARQSTFLGLAGIGDLIATCGSDLSRNRRLGLALAAGVSLDAARAALGGVAEGVGTTRAAVRLARELGQDMPITAELHSVLFEGKSPLQSMADLLARPARPEFPV